MGTVLTSWKDLDQAIQRWRASGRKLVFTNGCFDILHVGHVRYLQEARALADGLLVAINSDASVRKLKGPERPVNREAERAEVLAALQCVDFVTVFDQPTPEEIIRTVRPDFLVKGGDWDISKIVGAEFVQSYGGVVKSLKFIDGFSTTGTIEKMRRQD